MGRGDTKEWLQSLQRMDDEGDVIAAQARKRIDENKKKREEIYARRADQAAESLKNAKHIQSPKANPREAPVKEPKFLKRKKQLDELHMLKKEVENSKITDIKLDSSIEGMIIKLDALTKSKVLRKQIKDLLEEIEEFKVDGITGSEDIPKLLKKVEAQIKKTKNKKVVEELKALKKQVEETEFKELKEAKSYKEKHPESKAVKAAECPCGDSKEDLKACKKEVASLMRKLKKHTK
jgi:hypothetical protein